MNSFVNITVQSAVLNTSCGDELFVAKQFNGPAFLSWLFSRLRVLLYLSNPYEESFEFEDQVSDYQTETLPLVVSLVFIEWFILWLKGRPLPLLGDSVASSSMILMMECTRILTRGIEHTVYAYIHRHYRLIDLPWDSPCTWYLAALFVDFLYYWGHRASHEIHFLWAHHQAHHSLETYSLVNTFRLPFLQDWLYAFSYLPMALLISPSHYLVHLQLNVIYQFWLHTELVGKLGPLEWIINTPSHHQVHHGSNKFCLDRNYGGLLIIWDRIFGTFQEKKDDEKIVYGLVDQVQSFNPLYLQLFYFKKLYDKWCAMNGWKNKFLSLIKGPGWRPGSPWTGFIDEVPDVKDRKKYSYSPKSFWENAYVSIHFIIVFFAFECVNLFRDRMSPLAVFAHLIYVIFSLSSIGQGQLPILSKSLDWLGLVGLIGHSAENYIWSGLRIYFFFSALLWGVLSSFHTIGSTLASKEKKIS